MCPQVIGKNKLHDNYMRAVVLLKEKITLSVLSLQEIRSEGKVWSWLLAVWCAEQSLQHTGHCSYSAVSECLAEFFQNCFD